MLINYINDDSFFEKIFNNKIIVLLLYYYYSVPLQLLLLYDITTVKTNTRYINRHMIQGRKKRSNMPESQEESFFAKAEDPLYVSLLYGAISGSTVVAVGHPLDSIKVRLQTGTTSNIFRNLYKGVLPPFLAVVPSWMAVFLSYGVALKTLGSNDISSVALAGGFSGFFYTLAVCPFEFVKVNAQKQHISTLDAFNSLKSKVGFRGLYRGFNVCLLRDVSQSAAYYVCAESLNRSAWMKKYFKNEETRPFFFRSHNRRLSLSCRISIRYH